MHKVMSYAIAGVLASSLLLAQGAFVQAVPEIDPLPMSPSLDIAETRVTYSTSLDLLVFEQTLQGDVDLTLPNPAGQLDGAPVLGYVFPTTLQPEDVGFNPGEGIVALAATSHPDFDDTPLWDEDGDRDYANDGLIWHSHWVVLAPDERVPGGLSVKQFDPEDSSVVLPPTNPGMPMYIDSPGFSVVTSADTIKILVPAQRVNHQTDIRFDGVTAYMQVNISDSDRPLLGVYEVYSVNSGDLSLPYTVERN